MAFLPLGGNGPRTLRGGGAPRRISWTPQPGPQTFLLKCAIKDILYGGARGGGKTDGALGKWLQHQELYGRFAKGIFFRRRYKQLENVISRSKEMFRGTGARFYEAKDRYMWVFPNGATLKFRHLDKLDDTEEYLGHDYTFMVFEQMEQWPSSEPIDKMRGTLRSAHGVRTVLIGTANPGGPGHNWVKARYVSPATPGTPFVDTTGQVPVERVFIPAKVWDNVLLTENDPDYITNLFMTGPKWLVQAWLDGNWDIVPGAYFEDILDPDRHRIARFMPPSDWKRWRALDWGFSSPFSVGWYAMDFDGVIYRYRELYGCKPNQPNKGIRLPADELARRIVRIEKQERDAGFSFDKNPAGTDIWASSQLRQAEKELTIARIMANEGAKWVPANTTQGSRIVGWQTMVSAFYSDSFYVTENCSDWWRTVPVLMPDEDNPEDVDTEQEDHAGDETRYSIRSRRAAPAEPRSIPRGPNPRTFDGLVAYDEARKRQPTSKYTRAGARRR